MFRNRELRLRMERTDKNKNEFAPQDPCPLGMALIAQAPKLLVYGALAFFAYVALDTKRQVAVAEASNPRT